MQRTQELFPAPPAPPTIEVAENEAAEQLPPVPEPVVPALFASINTLLMRVSSLKEVGSGSVWIRDKNNILVQTDTSKIPTDKLSELVEAIAQQKVYILWDYRYMEFDELGPEWPKAHKARARLHQVRRQHLASRIPSAPNPCDDAD